MFDYDVQKLPQAVSDLVSTIMHLEYEGSRDKANDFLNKYAILSPELEERIARLKDLPIDIVCDFDTEKPGFFDEQ